MPKPMMILTWPQSARDALNERLRASAYSSLERNVQWLAEAGYKTSISTLQVYATRLRQLDAEHGVEAACLLLKRQQSNKALKVRRAGSWRSRLAAASVELQGAARLIDAVAARIEPADGTLLLGLSRRLLGVDESLQALAASPENLPGRSAGPKL